MVALLTKIADTVAYLLYVQKFFQKHKTLRKVLKWASLGTALAYLALEASSPGSGQTVVMVYATVFQMALALPFMILQFVALFWYLSRTKQMEILPGDPTTITWADYWGNEHVVELVRHWNKLLIEADEFKGLGGWPIKGILLQGPPGTGKTYLAKALAGSAGVPFYGCEGSMFRAMFIAVDRMKMEGFISKGRKFARQYGTCYLYIDEIDAVAMKRGGMGGGGMAGAGGGGLFGGGMIGMGALMALLQGLDGLDDTSLLDQCRNTARKRFGLPPIDIGTVVMLAATNRPDILDPAVTRPGRLDHKITIGAPDVVSRKAIIQGYVDSIRHDGSIDVDSLAENTAGCTPADIMSAIKKHAPRQALFEKREGEEACVTHRHVVMAFQEQRMGLENPIRDLEPRQKRQIAIHEAGHALMSYYLVKEKKIVMVSIVRRERALGYVLPVEKVDTYTKQFRAIINDILVYLAGHVATEVVLLEPWTGASADFQGVRAWVLYLAAHGFFGTFMLRDEPTPDLQKRIDARMREWIAYTRQFLTEHKAELVALADALYEREHLTGEEVEEIIREVQDEADKVARAESVYPGLDWGHYASLPASIPALEAGAGAGPGEAG